jgi:UDP-N-acetyl-2-amino-2-deoxyglucuronate dehydrogenase
MNRESDIPLLLLPATPNRIRWHDIPKSEGLPHSEAAACGLKWTAVCGNFLEFMKRPLGYAIIGCGRVFPNHLAGVGGSPDALLKAVCDIDAEKARRAADTAGLSDWETDYRRILQRVDVDIVDICLPHHLHCPVTLDAVDRGKHVLCEKPISLNAAEAHSMISRAEKKNVRLGVVYQNRYNTAYVKIRRAIDQGLFGRLIAATCTMHNRKSQDYYRDGWHGRWETEGGGTLTTQASHNLDLLCWFLGEPSSVTAHTATLTHHIQVEDTAAITLGFQSGAVASMVSTNSSATDWHQSLEIIGTRGSVLVVNNRTVRWDLPPQSGSGDEGGDITGDEAGDEDADIPLPGAAGYGPSHPRLICDFIDAVLHERPFPLHGREALKVSQVIWAAYRSARTGRREEVARGAHG